MHSKFSRWEKDTNILFHKLPEITLLPASKQQREALRNQLNSLFIEANAKVPKEIVGIVSGFI